MTWNSIWPDPAKSVKANTTPGQQNTTYTETTMNVSHYWNKGVNLDGQHQFVAAPKQATDIAVPTSMDGVIYYKEVSVTNNRVQGFYRNSNGIYQFIPSFISGTIVFTNTTDFVVVTPDIPNNSYGTIFFWADSADVASFQYGNFKAISSVLQGYSVNQGGFLTVISLANGPDASALQLKAKLNGLGGGLTYQYRITYWGM